MDKTLLEQKINEWNKACEFFEQSDVQLLLTDEEKTAVSFLINFWKNNEFDKTACEQRIEVLKQNDVNHSPHREVIEKSKSLRGISATFYTKDANLYNEFRVALGWLPVPQDNPQIEPIPRLAFDEVLILSYVEKWSKAIQYLKKEEVLPFLEADELTAIELLADMWRRPKFQSAMKEEATEMIEVLVASHRMHSSNREIIEQSKSLCGVARKIYSNEEIFYAFKKAITQYYKNRKPPKRAPKEQIPQPKVTEIIIKDVLFANKTYSGDIIKDYGKIVYFNTLYISPLLVLSSNYWGDEEIEVILGYPDGKTQSYKTNVSFKGSGKYALSGWGNDKGNSYLSYNYVFYTFKCHNKVLWQGNVSIEKDPTSAEFPIIGAVLFSATDSQDRIIIPWGAAIPTGIAYLKPQISVDNNFYGVITVDIEYRYEKRSTTFTKCEVNINGPGRYSLSRWGRDDCTYYLNPEIISCTFRYQGVVLYSTTVQIGQVKKKPVKEEQQTSNSKWSRLNSKIRDVGCWFFDKYEDPEDMITLFSIILFLIYAIVVVITWINKTFFNALITGIIGFFVVGLIIGLIEKVAKVVFWILAFVFLNVWTLLATLGIGVAVFISSI